MPIFNNFKNFLDWLRRDKQVASLGAVFIEPKAMTVIGLVEITKPRGAKRRSNVVTSA
jgi:hypothetical protein